MPNDKTYEAIPLFGEDGKIQYNGEVKPIFDHQIIVWIMTNI